MDKRDQSFLQLFGERVRTLRAGLGLSQEDFAAKCGLDRTYVSGIERGRRNPSLRIVRKLAAELGVTVSQLFDGLK